ncbi:MAG TPA: uroporphyrinogen-III C-methyltransferase [Candidatus Hydrogenedentes bacterium]|nr:uroporphyrinogen-III C-methyltransferase [Candidatus Hydrogenedentota bacterium]
MMGGGYGTVYLVGAGPGDPGLITVRGRDLLERADAVVYDYLANDALLAYAPRAEHIFAGKRPGGHLLPQEEINRILVACARRLSCVVRLKGGDPFVFGRGGEEALALADQGIPFEIVPGVTAGVGASAYAGIPLTHRRLTQSVTFVTGHCGAGQDEGPELSRLAEEGTLVVYMGVKRLAHVVARLIAIGRSPATPAAIVEWGTYPRQRTLVATLATLEEESRRAVIEPPAILIIGEVVALREQLHWFERRWTGREEYPA